MVVVYCSDENFVQHLLVSITSLHHHNKCEELIIYILDGGISKTSNALLKHFSEKAGFNLSFIEVDISLYENFLVDGHISRATYYRISIPDLLPVEHDKVLYLDCDIVVNDSIVDLWQHVMGDFAIAAVPEFDNIRNIEMGLGNTKTFNAGVLLLNLKKWRAQDLSSKVLIFIKENSEKIKFHDQDALNAVLVQDWLELPIKWNLTSKFIARRKGIINKELLNQIDQPAIIHFNESFKPWHYQLRHPKKYLYRKFLKKTPFKKYSPPDRTFINVIRKGAALLLISLRLKKQYG